MNENKLLKVLCSLPILLITLYFIPFLGICLSLLRCYIYRNRKQKTPLLLIICGILILIPSVANYLITLFKINVKISHNLNNILTSDIYTKLLSYSKLLITLGVILLIISFILTKISNKINSGIKSYIKQDLQKDYEIRKENDLKMQEKREIAKNTHVVRCPYCGSDNMLNSTTGTCTFCRRKIEYKK